MSKKNESVIKNNNRSAICRTVDQLGRIVIPSEWRKILDWAIGDDIEISRDGDCIILKKAEPTTDSEIQAVKRFAKKVSSIFISEDSKTTFDEFVEKFCG